MAPARSLLLVDDHGLVRHGIQLLLQDALPELRVILAGSLAEAVATLARERHIDLVLLDLTLGDAHGMAGLRRLRDEHPEIPVVIVSAQDERDTVLAALDAGAMGFISKAAPPDELRAALQRVLVDHAIHLPQSISGLAEAAAAGGRSLSALGLTERQTQVLGLVVRGLSNKEIARRLDISEVMVKKHITPALQALGVTSRTKALVALSQHGYRTSVDGA